MHRLVVGVVLLAVTGSAAACTSSASSLRARDPATATSTQIVAASYTAVLAGKRVSLTIPSGRVDLVLTTPRSTVAAENVKGAAPLVAAKGAALVGVSWVLQRAAYPDSPNRQLAEPSAIFGDPQPVQLWLVTDGTRRAIPDVDDLTSPAERPNTAVWMSVPVGVRTWQFQLGYDGVTQTVDARTGKVVAGRAAALYRPLPLNARGTCTLAGSRVLTSCLTDYAVGYPYVTGGGWAPPGKTWLLLQITLDSDFHGAQQVTVAGAKPQAEINDHADPLTPFLVPAGATSLPIRGTVTADDIDRAQVRTKLTGKLRGVSL